MNLPPQYRSQLNTLLQFTQQKDLRHGRALHAHILRTGSLACTTVANGLISFYAKCGDLINAKLVFNSISLKDVVSWNCLINGYSQRGLGGSRLILELFQRMRAENELPDFHTFSGVFTAASKGSDTSEGQQVHTLAIKMASFHDVFVGSSLLNMYCKVGLTADARKVFDRMPERNSVSWATMLSGYASRRLAVETLGLFESMRREGEVETEFVFTSVLSALAAPEFIETGRQLHGAATKDGILSFVSVGNALLTMYSKCGGVEDARRAFQTLSDKDSITWSAMITGFAQSGESHKALSLFSDMHSSGVEPCDEFTLVGVINACSDIVALDQGKQLHGYALRLGSGYQMYVLTALVDMYAKCGCTDDARKGFDYLQGPDTVLWTSMIGGYAQNGENEDALYLYCRMQMKRIAPNELTIVNVLKACSSLSALEQGKQIHASIVKFGLGLEVCMGSALSAMYTKCGSLDDGELVFRKMLARDVVSWNAMISGFAQNGLGDDALKLFDEMILEGTKPDSVTFVNILSACSHMGSVDRAWSYFNIMMGKFGIAPGIEHYACMVDVLSRAGKLNEAKDFIESAQVDHGLCLWRTLLSACKNHHSYELGAYAGEKLMKLGTPESSAYVQLSSIYAALGKREDVDRVRSLMKTRGVAKEPGCSWIELKSGVHVFLVGDQMHPEVEEIQSLLRILSEQMEDDVQEEKALAAPVFDLSSSSGFLNSDEEDIVEARRSGVS